MVWAGERAGRKAEDIPPAKECHMRLFSFTFSSTFFTR